MEHRWGQRRVVHEPVRLRTAGGMTGTGHIVSVSISGAFVKTALPALPLAVILVRFMPERPQRAYSRFAPIIEAHVVRRTEDGIALEWCDSAAELTRVLGEIPTQLDDFGDCLPVSSRAPNRA
jgi:hypothetical protein